MFVIVVGTIIKIVRNSMRAGARIAVDAAAFELIFFDLFHCVVLTRPGLEGFEGTAPFSFIHCANKGLFGPLKHALNQAFNRTIFLHWKFGSTKWAF